MRALNDLDDLMLLGVRLRLMMCRYRLNFLLGDVQRKCGMRVQNLTLWKE